MQVGQQDPGPGGEEGAGFSAGSRGGSGRKECCSGGAVGVRWVTGAG